MYLSVFISPLAHDFDWMFPSASCR